VAFSATFLPGGEAPDRLAQGALPPAVVFAGEETFLAEEGIAAVLRRVFPDDDPGGGVLAVDASSPADAETIPALVDELLTPSLFGEGKVVIVRRAESLGAARSAATEEDDDAEPDADARPEGGGAPASADAVGAVTLAPAQSAGKRRASPLTTIVKAACAAPAPGRVLILSTKRPVKGKGAISADAMAKAGALLVDCRRLYDTVPPWSRGTSPFDTEVAKWVARRARAAHGKTMDARAAHGLSMRAGPGLAPLAAALETLSTYVGARSAITEADVAATVAVTREDPAWTLADAVLAGDAPRALELAGAAFERGLSDAKGRVSTRPEAVYAPLWNAVHGAWRKAMLVAEAKARGDDPMGLPALSGLPPFVVERLAAQAARRSPEDLVRRHRAFVEAEHGVRGGGVPPRVAFERMVVALTT